MPYTMTGMTDDGPHERAADEALTELATAISRAITAVGAIRDPSLAFAAARRLFDLLEEAVESTRKLRVQTAHHLYKAGALSLAGLAERAGVSKSRAQQMVNAAKKEEQDV